MSNPFDAQNNQPNETNYQSPFKPPADYVSPRNPNQLLKPFGFPNQSKQAQFVLKATFLHRTIATIFDILLFIPFICIYGVGVAFSLTYNRVTGSYDSNFSLVPSLFFNIAYYAYLVLMVGRGQSLGNKIINTRVIDKNGNPPGFNQALARFAIPFANTALNLFFRYTAMFNYDLQLFSFFELFPLLLVWFGYFWVLWDKDKQTIYDKIAGMYVVQVWSD